MFKIQFTARQLFVLSLLFAIVVVKLFAASSASAQSGGSFDLTWNTIDGGGATFSTGGAYQLGGTIGQADVGTMSGGAYSLSGGFWVNLLGNNVMLPFITR